tara:strand:+ start:1616 stop:6349 length:4734 start_codon:yes stop_codon:yes gene_type:complete
MAIFSKITSKNTHNSSNGTVKKKDVVFDTSISAAYSDFSHGQDDTILVKGGITSFSALIDLPTAIPPTFGDAKVKDYQLGLNLGSISQAPGNALGEYFVYKSKQPLGNNEGDMEIEHADLLVYSSYVDDEPHTDFWQEDFTSTINFNEEITQENAAISRKIKPYMNFYDAFECRELSTSMKVIEASGKFGSGPLGTLAAGLTFVAGAVGVAGKPQVIHPEQMAKLYSAEGMRGPSTMQKGGREGEDFIAQATDMTVPVKTDPNDPQYWVPRIVRAQGGVAEALEGTPVGFHHPRWKKSKVSDKILWMGSDSVPKSTGDTNAKLLEENTFLDTVRNVRDIKFVTNDGSTNNTDEEDFSASRITFDQGKNGNALLMDQWIDYAFAGDTTNGTFARQPSIDFGLQVPNKSANAHQDIFIMKKIPKPVRLTMDDETAQGSISAADAEADGTLSSYYHIDTSINFKNLEPTYQTSNRAYTNRAFHIVFSEVEPNKNEAFATYMLRAVGQKTAEQASSQSYADYERTSNVVTITVTADVNKTVVVGQRVRITGTPGYDGNFTVTAKPTATTFTYDDTGVDVAAGVGAGTFFVLGVTCGITVINHAGRVRMESLNQVRVDQNNSIPYTYYATTHSGESLKKDSTQAEIPQDTWLDIKILTDEEGPNKNFADADNGVFEVLVSDQSGRLLHDEAFVLRDLQHATVSGDTFRHDSDALDDEFTHHWPQYMSIWQQNFPSRVVKANVTGGDEATGEDISEGDNNLSGDSDGSANGHLAKNRKVRMTTCIDHIHVNGAGHTKYALLTNDNRRTAGEGYITNNTPLTDMIPNFTTGEHNFRYSPCTLSFGFKNIQHLETVNGASNSGHFLFSGFNTTNFTDRTAIDDNKLSAGYNFPTVPAKLGHQAFAPFFTDSAGTSGIDIQDDPSYTDTEPVISVGYNATHHKHAVESFVQKGTILFKEGSNNRMTQSGDEWTKRENIYCASRITKIIDPVSGIFEIDDTKILEADTDERYIIFCTGDTFQTADQLDADGTNGDSTWVAPVKIIDVDETGRRLSIVAYTDENEGTEVATFASLLTENKLSRLMISPYRYWFCINIIGNNKFPQRSYKSVLPVNAFSNPGATFNESDFYSVVDGSDLQQYYYNARSFNLVSNDTSTLELEKDYGFGSLNGNEAGGMKGGYVGKMAPDSIGLKLIDLPNLHSVDKPKADEIQTFYVTSGVSDAHAVYFFSSNYTTDTTQRPLLVTRFEDSLPEVDNFKVIPDDESDGFYPKFTWNTSSNDIWYGFLNITNENIYSQYTDAVLHFPLNEEGVHGTAASVPTENISGTTNTISGALYDLEGLAGNALRFDGNNDYVECNNSPSSDPTAACTTEMTVVAHIKPDSGVSDQQFIVAQSSRNNLEKFHIRTNTSNQVEARVHFGAGSNYVDLTSGIAIAKDGQQPSVIMLTVDTTLSAGNVKLFVNGKLEAQSGVATTSGSTTAWKIGQNIHGGTSELYIGNSASSGSNGFAGLIEEVVVYKKCLYPVDVPTGEAVVKKEFSELTASALASSKPLNARLFIKDYHNIRGTTSTEVCNTPQVSWRKAGFRLDFS